MRAILSDIEKIGLKMPIGAGSARNEQGKDARGWLIFNAFMDGWAERGETKL